MKQHLCAAIAACFFVGAATASPTSVPGERAWPQPKRAEVDFRLPWSSASASEVVLRELSTQRIEEVQRYNAASQDVLNPRVLMVGVHRHPRAEAEANPVPARWTAVPNGQVAQFRVQSTGAAALRLALRTDLLPLGSEVRVRGGGDKGEVYAHTFAEMVSNVGDSNVFWAAAVDGEAIEVEWFVPRGAATALPTSLPIEKLSHTLPEAALGFGLPQSFLKNRAGDGDLSCISEVECRRSELGSAFTDAERAVARITFERSDFQGRCTGTLLNDADPGSQRPFVLTANHCIRNQNEAVSTVAEFNFTSRTCPGSIPINQDWGRVVGGADFRFGTGASDITLLELRAPVPSSAFFAGWDASPFTEGVDSPIFGIHHPMGATKRVSEGDRWRAWGFITAGGVDIPEGVHVVNWRRGATQTGSSGSGIFTVRNNQWFLRGTLIGGESSCSTQGQRGPTGPSGTVLQFADLYSRFDLIFPRFERFLTGGGSFPAPSTNVAGAWFVPAESGWGATIYPIRSGDRDGIFMLWFVYDAQGRANWYQLQDTWDAGNLITADVVQVTSPTGWRPGTVFNGASNQRQVVGQATLRPTSDNRIELSMTIDGQTRSVVLERLI